MFLNFLQGGHRRMSRSEDLEAVQGISAMGNQYPTLEMEVPSILLRVCYGEDLVV